MERRLTRHTLWFFAATLIAVCAACQPYGAKPDTPQIDLYPAGHQTKVVRVAALLERQPIGETRLDPTRHYQGAPGWALAPGTVVRRGSIQEPLVQASYLGSKVDQYRHPWIFVSVIEPAIEGQAQRYGWVHISDLEVAGEAEQSLDVAQMQPQLLQKLSWLCTHPERSPEPGKNCSISLHPDLPLHILGCQNGFAQVELWDPDGKYVSGFVRKTAFKSPPCK